MKLITVVLRPVAFETLKEALALFGVHGMTVTQVHRAGDHAGRVELYRGQRFHRELEPNLRVEVLAADDEAPDLLRVVARILRAEAGADQRLWSTRVDLVVRVRTGECGLDAL